ncbi:hypothetical protein [Clostridium oceanicum]|uniref:Bypass of forespore C C-terminal domain-containing protein n=1 Tax=Clostridium oceanicum TaxID=1543 RepID=A0ABN1JW15_9CLOT
MDIKKRNVIIILISFVVLFVSIYYIALVRTKSSKADSSKRQVNSLEDGNGSVTVGSNKDGVLSKEGKLVFKLQYTKGGDFVKVREENVKDSLELEGKDRKQIENMYKEEGYEVEKFTSAQVTLLKKIDKYMPNKYVLGIKGDKIAIYRTDENGNMYIEDEQKDITDIKINRLKEQDIEMLTKGNKYFQCDTREEVESRLGDYE